MAERKQVPIALQRRLAKPNEPQKPASQFLWTGLAKDIQLEIGHTDLADLRRGFEAAKTAGEGAEPQPVELLVSDRFLLSPEAAKELFKVMRDIVKYLRDNSYLPPEGEGDDPAQ